MNTPNYDALGSNLDTYKQATLQYPRYARCFTCGQVKTVKNFPSTGGNKPGDVYNENSNTSRFLQGICLVCLPQWEKDFNKLTTETDKRIEQDYTEHMQRTMLKDD